MAVIFIVEDNDTLREVIVTYIKLENHEVIEFDKTADVINSIKKKSPHLIILDIMLPDGDGFSLAKQIREKYNTPIIFLTAKSSESDRITGFELGGDDYVVKPFSPKELVLRVKAVLNRTNPELSKKYKENTASKKQTWILNKHSLLIDKNTHVINADKKKLSLTPVEWKLLVYLADHPGQVFSREQLLESCFDYFVSSRTIDTHIKNLRNKLGYSAWINTVRSFGYSFKGKLK